MVQALSPTSQATPESGRNVLDVLMERGFVENVSDEAGLREALADPATRPITMYIGFDPTASSLHIGNLLGIMLMAHVQRHGHRPIALIGGGTGMIGDPTDKSSTRPILTLEQIQENIVGQRPQEVVLRIGGHWAFRARQGGSRASRPGDRVADCHRMAARDRMRVRPLRLL